MSNEHDIQLLQQQLQKIEGTLAEPTRLKTEAKELAKQISQLQKEEEERQRAEEEERQRLQSVIDETAPKLPALAEEIEEKAIELARLMFEFVEVARPATLAANQLGIPPLVPAMPVAQICPPYFEWMSDGPLKGRYVLGRKTGLTPVIGGDRRQPPTLPVA